MSAPLADKLRPESIDDMVGQSHLLGKNKPIRNIVESGFLPNIILYGPPGTGKTTLAKIIAKNTDRKLHHLNGTNASIANIKDIISELDTDEASNGILLYLDEIQYFNKKQQQSLLEYIENGKITLIASTTENPYFYIYNAILSRCVIFEFKPIIPEDIVPAITRGFKYMKKEIPIPFDIDEDIYLYIATACNGDVRKSLNFVELCSLSAPILNGKRVINIETVKTIIGKNIFLYDKSGDEHYDLLSAFQKSMRGSDPDASVHYLARLLEIGDMTSAIRRLLVCAAEDVGLAYPQILPIVKSACDIALQVGLPEAAIPLSDAVILVATSPKSATGHDAIHAALNDVRNSDCGNIPRHLQNNHFDGSDIADKGQHYFYPHAYPNHWVQQQYLPDKIKDKKYYTFGDNKLEQSSQEFWKNIKGE